MRRVINLGKVDYTHTGKANCKVTVEVELEGGRLSICGNIWNPRETDIYSGGQNIEEIADLFKGSRKVQRIKAIWERWHLNDMKAGTPAQETELKKHTFPGYPKSHYEWALETLHQVGPFTVWAFEPLTPEQDAQEWGASLAGKHFKRPAKVKVDFSAISNSTFYDREHAEIFAKSIAPELAPEIRGLECDNGYKYGSAWLKEELPAEVIAEVESWFTPETVSA